MGAQLLVNTFAPKSSSGRETFTPSFAASRIIARLSDRYELVENLGRDEHSVLLKVIERNTRIERTARLFATSHKSQIAAALAYAHKLHRLKGCGSIPTYVSHELVKTPTGLATIVVCDGAPGLTLDRFANSYSPLSFFEVLHLLQALGIGLERIHERGEYHGALSVDLTRIKKQGLGFNVWFLGIAPHSKASLTPAMQKKDVSDLIKIVISTFETQLLPRTLSASKQKTQIEKARVVRKLKRCAREQSCKDAKALIEILQQLSW